MKKSWLNDTIVAISSPPGRAERGILRLSGDKAFELLSTCTDLPRPLPKVYSTEICLSRFPSFPALCFLMPHPHSYTTEDMVEVHTLGSPKLLRLLLEHFLSQGARLARPGEFTQRAVLHGRIDFFQAEAVLALIEAEEEEELRLAQRFLSGDIGKHLKQIQEDLKVLLSELHAYIDFPDYDVEPEELDHFHKKLEQIEKRLLSLSWAFQRSQKGETATVAIWGKVNTGKSTLFNQLVGSHRALVTSYPFTTRDVISQKIVRKGKEWLLWDLPGFGTPKDELEKKAEQLGWEFAKQADFVLFLLESQELSPREREALQFLEKHKTPFLSLSPRERKVEEIWRKLERQTHFFSLFPQRQVEVFEKTCQSLQRAKTVSVEQIELMAIDLEEALEAMAHLLGEVDHEEILDLLFSRFCIGK